MCLYTSIHLYEYLYTYNDLISYYTRTNAISCKIHILAYSYI